MTNFKTRLVTAIGSSRKTQSSLSLAILIALAPDLALPAWADSETVWKITYTVAFYNKCTVFIAPDAVKVVNEDGAELLARAPKWDGYAINTKTRAVCMLPYATWYARKSFMNVSELEPTSSQHIIDERSTFLGIPSVHYSYKGRVVDGLWQDRQRPMDCVNQYFGTTNIPITDTQRDIITAWFGVPRTKELPLFWGRIFADGSKHYTLKATSVSKQKLPVDTFAMPAKVKKVNTVYEVFERQNKDIIDSIAGFAASQTLGKEKPQK